MMRARAKADAERRAIGRLFKLGDKVRSTISQGTELDGKVGTIVRRTRQVTVVLRLSTSVSCPLSKTQGQHRENTLQSRARSGRSPE